jgi:type VI secretion system protein ImpF
VARIKAEALITQSLMDRLANAEDWPATRFASMRMYRETLKREVEWLLNTRQSPMPELEGYTQATSSVINYGLPDIHGFTGSAGREHNALTNSLLKTLRAFEPRIKDPQVFLVRSDTTSRSLRFHIEGRISFENMEEEIKFDTVLELMRGEYEVK